jgi:hypothetical protein
MKIKFSDFLCGNFNDRVISEVSPESIREYFLPICKRYLCVTPNFKAIRQRKGLHFGDEQTHNVFNQNGDVSL